jgi:hydrogenase maturation protease
MGKRARRVQVIGIGSGIGLDEIGWRLVERLARVDLKALAPSVEWVLDGCAIPAQLPALARDADVVVLIDALPGVPGSLQRIDWRDLADENALCSSHGVDVRQGLELMSLLAEDPPDIRIFGVGVGDVSAPAEQPATVDELIERATGGLLKMLAADFR